MSCHRLKGVVLLAGLALAVRVGVIVAAGPAPAPDALSDAKRRAAADLMREGKTADAVAMLQEVIRSDPDQYKDHLQLARALDKLNRSSEASEAYHRTADLIAARHVDDRATKAEVERRLRVLDAQTAKVAAAEDEFLKKLDALEREAVAARDMRALERVFRDRGGVWAAQGRRDALGFEVAANGEWQDTHLTVQQGVTYQIRAAGTWTIHPGVTCSPDGTTALPGSPWGATGGLIAAVGGDARHQWIGSNGVFTAPATGHLVFICNMTSAAERAKNQGKVFVLAVRQ